MAELDKVLENEQRVENNKQQAEDLYNTAANVQGGNDEWLNEMQGKLNAVKPKQQAQPTTNDAWLDEQQKKLEAVAPKTGNGRITSLPDTTPLPEPAENAPKAQGTRKAFAGVTQEDLDAVSEENARLEKLPYRQADSYIMEESNGEVKLHQGGRTFVFPSYDAYNNYFSGKAGPESYKVYGAKEHVFDPNNEVYVSNLYKNWGAGIFPAGNEDITKALKFDAYKGGNAGDGVEVEDDYSDLTVDQLESKIDELIGDIKNGYDKGTTEKRLTLARLELAAKKKGYKNAKEAKSHPNLFRYQLMNEAIAKWYPSEFSPYLLDDSYSVPYADLMGANPLKTYFGSFNLEDHEPITVDENGNVILGLPKGVKRTTHNIYGGTTTFKSEYENIQDAKNALGEDGNDYAKEGHSMGDYDIWDKEGNPTNPLAIINKYLMSDNKFSRAYTGWVALVTKMTGQSPTKVWEDGIKDYVGDVFNHREKVRKWKMESLAKDTRERLGWMAPLAVGADGTILSKLFEFGIRIFADEDTRHTMNVMDEAYGQIGDILRKEGFWSGYAIPISTSFAGDFPFFMGSGKLAQLSTKGTLKGLGQAGTKQMAKELRSALMKQTMSKIEGKAMMSGFNLGFYSLMSQTASDLSQLKFSGLIPYAEAFGSGFVGGSSLAFGGAAAAKMRMRPTNLFKATANRFSGAFAELSALTAPQWLEASLSGEMGKEGYIYSSLMSNVCMMGSCKGQALLMGGAKSPASKKTSEKTIKELRDKGYDAIADDLERRNKLHIKASGGEFLLELSEAGEEQMRRLSEDMEETGKGVAWDTFAELSGAMGYGVIPPGASDVRMIENGDGTYTVQAVDDKGRAITSGKTYTAEERAEAEKEHKELSALVPVIVENRNRTLYDSQAIQYVYAETCRRIADSINEGKSAYDENGNIRDDYSGCTANDVAQALSAIDLIPENRRTKEQKEFFDYYSSISKEMMEEVQSAADIRDIMCEQYGISEKEFDDCMEKAPDERGNGKAAQAVEAFNKVMSDGFYASSSTSIGYAEHNGKFVEIYRAEPDVLYVRERNADGTLGNLKEIPRSEAENIHGETDPGWVHDADVQAKREADMESAIREYSYLTEDQLREVYNDREERLKSGVSEEEAQEIAVELAVMDMAAAEKGYDLGKRSEEKPLPQDETNQTSSATGIDLEPPANDSAETPDVIEPEGESAPVADPLRRKKAEAFLESFFGSLPKEDKEKLIDYYASREDLDSIISEHLEKTNDEAGKAAYDEALKRIYKYGEEEIGLETRQPETPKPENDMQPAKVETGTPPIEGIEQEPFDSFTTSKGKKVNLYRQTSEKDGIKTTRVVATKDGKEANIATAHFPLPDEYEIDPAYLADGEIGEVLGVHELRESKDGANATIVVRDENGLTLYETKLNKKDSANSTAKDRIDELLDAMGFDKKEERDEQRAYYEDKNNAEQFEKDYRDFVGKEEPQPQEPQQEEVKTEDKKDEVVDNSQQENEIIDDLDAPMPMKKVKGKDKPDYSKTTPRKGHDYLINKSGLEKEEVLDKVDYEISKAKNKVKALEKKQPSIKDKRFDGDEDEYLQAKAEWQNELNAAKAEQEYWEEVQEIEKVQGSINEIDGAKSWTSVRDVFNKIRSRFSTDPKIRSLIDSFTPQTLYDACMDYLSGGVRFIWYGDKNNKGLQQEKGWGEEERKNHIGMIASKEKGGITPQKAVHDIVDLYGQDLGLTLDQGKEIFDTLIDALDGISTRGDAADYIRRRKLEAVRDELARRLEGETNTYDTVADRYYDEQVQQYRDEHPELEGATNEEVIAAMERERNMGNEVQNENPPATEQQPNDTIPNETGVSDDFFENSGEEVPFSLKQEQTESKETVTSDVRARLEDKLGKDLTDRIEGIAKSLGVKVRFTDEDVNGFMDHDEGVLYIGKNIDSNKTEAFVAGHELTHEMQTLSEGKGSDVYDTFKKAALEWAKEHREEGGKGYDFDWVKSKYENHFRNKYKNEALERGMSEAEAEAYAEQRVKEKVTDDYVNDEIAANVAGRMLENPAVAEDLFKLREAETPQERRTRLQRILDWIKELISKRRIGNKKPEELTPEEQKLLDLRDKFNDMYNEVVREDLNTQGIETAKKGDARYAVKDTLEGEERERAIEDLMEVTGRSRATVVKWLTAEQSLAKVILDGDNQKFLDLQVDESVPSIWNNSDYPQGTVEFSNICRKRLPFTVIYQRLQKEFPNRVFDASTLEDIRQIMKDNGEDVACGLCFVEDRRQLLGEIGDGFINAVKGENADINENQRKALEKLRESGDGYIPNLYELLTLDGMKKLRKDHPAVAQAFVDYNNARGMQAGRLFQAYSAYHREILNWNKAKIKSVNDAGGLRIFSFSDFEAHHLIDLVQVLTDCAAKGIKVQGYTKVPEFAKAVKDTKAKINRSLIAKGKGYVDENYVPQEGEAVSPNVIDGKRLLFDTVEGIDVNHPDFFDSTGNKNVGNIVVGINDEHIRLAMLDPFVDYIIPFHSGLSEAIRAKKGIGDWENYKLTQLEKKFNENGKLVNADKHGINIYTDVLPRGEELIGKPIRNARDFQMAFFKACEEKGWVPRFSKFINKNKKGEYVYTPGYEKLLTDFKLFDKNGKLLPQEAVEPRFDNDFNKTILDKYVEGEKSKVPYDELYAKVKEGLGLNGTHYEEMAESVVEDTKVSQEEKEERNIRFSLVEDPEEIERLDKEPVEYGYRNVSMKEDGSLRSPMADKLGKKGEKSRPTAPFEIDRWERSDENPDLATDNGKINLIKPNGLGSVGSVDYNPYIHIRPTTLNKQFKNAWERNDLVYIKVAYPTSELSSGYHAAKAKLPVGRHPWNGGDLILSRWDKPVKWSKTSVQVPWKEVAVEWIKEFRNSGVRFEIVPPKLLPILAENGVEILPPTEGMGKSCNDAYKTWKDIKENGTHYNEAEINDFIGRAREEAEVIPQSIEFNQENWDKFFPNNKVITPLGEIKLGKHQYEKTINRSRQKEISLTKATLERPNIIIEEYYPERGAERQSAYLFVKTFIKEDGTKYRHYESVTVKKDGMEASFSNHYIKENQLKGKIKEGRVLYEATRLDAPRQTPLENPTQTNSGVPSVDKVTTETSNLQENGEKTTESGKYSLKEDTARREERRDSEESKNLFDATKKKFGTTNDFREAGYILPDGTMLDFSGRHWMNEGDDFSHLAGQRHVDHRSIYEVEYGSEEVPTGFKTNMSDFIERGAIRINGPGGINLSMPPTKEQAATLRRYIQGRRSVAVDFGNGDNTEHYAFYGDDIHPTAPYLNGSRVLADIDRYYSEGIKPKGDPVPYYSLREEGDRDFAAEMRELMRRRLRGEDVTAELEQLRADRRAAEAARSGENPPVASTGGAGNGEPPIEPPTPPAPPTPEPAPELPPTDYDRPMSPIEMAKAAAIKAVADTKASLEQRNAARRELTASLRDIHKAMRIQKEYDRATVENVVSLCKMMVQSGLIDHRYISNLTPLFTKLKDATGKQDLTSTVNDIMDVMLKSQERSARNEIAKLLNTKGTKVDQNGVVTQAGLDIRGQHTMKELSEYMGKGSVIIDNHIAKLEEERSRIPDGHQERIDDIDDKILGSQLAKQFSQIEETHSVNISEAEEDLNFLKERYKAGEIGIKEYTEQKHALENLIRSYRMAQTDALWNQANAMRHVIAGSKEGTRNWIEQQKERKNEIRHDANSDMEGLSKQTQGDPTAKQRLMNMGIPRFLSSSLYTLQTMLKSLGGKHAMGEGYLYNRFFRGWMKNRDAEITEYRNDMNLLNKKAKEITGFNYFGLYDMIMMLPKMRVEYMDGGEMVPHELDQGQLGYAYMVNKMEDGAAALRNMGITEEKMQEISNFLNPNLKKFYDWLQDDFLADKWEGMNEVHRRMFGADMDRVANYIPLHRDREAGTQKVDISQNGEPPLQSTVVGSIIQRVHSNLGIDLKHNNAVDVVAKHLLEATHWKHFSEWKRDANTLLSDTSFRNKVKNSDTIYGSGDQLWSRLNDVFKIAGGDYSTPPDRKFKVNESVINMARAVNAAKVSMRVFTATKQLLSLPVFATECNTATLIKNLGFLLSPDKTSGSPTQNSFVWCLQNLPQFRERVMSRTSGETRLENGDLGWGFSRQRVFENAARIGLAPNAFIDACTVAAGAKSIYEKRFAQYKKNGYSEKAADEKAKIDAEIAFNESQQSSEKAFVSPIQVDRDAVSLGLSTFRNASMGYERKFVDAVRNFKHLTMGGKEYRDTLVKRKEKELIEQGMDKAEARAAAEKEYKWVPGAKAYREVTMEFMKKQMMRDGLTETQAKAAAERLYRRALWRSTLNFLMFGFGAQMAWNVGGKLPYLIFGDNDEEKKRILKQAAVHAGIGGWVEGLPTGDMLSEGMTNWAMNLIDNGNPLEGASFFEFDPDLLTLTSDVVKVTKALEGPNPLKGATTFVNLLGQIFTGVNPETFTDAGVAIYDACNGDPETSNEALMCVLRIMQCPQSQLDQMYIDELRMSAREAQGLTPEEVARRYAYYKAHKDTPYMWWIYNQGKKDEIVKKYEENFNKKLNEDVKEDGGTAEDYHDLMESATTKKEHDKYKNKEIAELSARGPEALMKAWDAEHAKGADADYKYMRSLMSRYQKDVYGEGKMPTAEDEAANYKEEHGEDLSEQAEKIGRDLGFEAQDSYYQMSQFKTQNAPSKNRVMKAWGETGASFRYTEDGEFFDMDEYKVKLPVEDKAKRARAMKLVEENKDEMQRIYRNAWRMKKISALYKTADELKKKWEIKLMFIPTPTIDLKDAKAISDAYKEVQQLLNDEATDREMDRKAKKKGFLNQ